MGIFQSGYRGPEVAVHGKDNHQGRRNRYQVHSHLPLREAISRERTIGELLDLLAAPEGDGGRVATGG